MSYCKILCFKTFIVFSLVFSISIHSSAQVAADSTTTAAPLTGTRKALATIIFAGLGGAVVGLSTLSFYGRPQDYMANIALGFAVGIIAGTVVVTFRTATNLSELNGSNLNEQPLNANLNSASETSRSFADIARYSQAQPSVQLGWSF
jgi:hypothetical protein